MFNTRNMQRVMLMLGVLFYVQAWFDLAVHAYSQSLCAGLVMFTLFIGASHVAHD